MHQTAICVVAGSAVWLASSIAAQHCGGPCEIPRGADPEAFTNRYVISQGVEMANWRYLNNWHWTVDGVQIHSLESVMRRSPLADFGYRRMFASPSGNGFLVTGNPFAEDRIGDREPPLFVFCDPQGSVLMQLTMREVLKPKEQVLGPCPNCDCQDVLYEFRSDPRISSNGCFVELVAKDTSRTHGVFLPWGALAPNRWDFDKALAEAEWARLTLEQAATAEVTIASLLGRLASDDLDVRTRAADGLLAQGFLAWKALGEARDSADSGDLRARIVMVQKTLRPLGGLPWEALSNDLGLLTAAMASETEPLAEAARAQMNRVLPATEGLSARGCAEWIAAHRDELVWDAAARRYR